MSLRSSCVGRNVVVGRVRRSCGKKRGFLMGSLGAVIDGTEDGTFTTIGCSLMREG